MANELIEFSLEPKTLEEAMKLAELIANSDLVPKDYQHKPGNVLIAVQMGREVGLKPMQALQNIAVINGRPCLWGDALLAIVRGSGLLEDFREDFDGQTWTATCSAKRKGQPSPIIRHFSKVEAERAGLWNKKPSPWATHPQRMLQLRARAFVLRDGFADVLKGLAVAEEAQDIEPTIPDALPAPVRIEPPRRLSDTPSEGAASAEVHPAPANGTVNGEWRELQSKYAGRCDSCNGEIAQGETIQYNTQTRKAWHPTCLNAAPA